MLKAMFAAPMKNLESRKYVRFTLVTNRRATQPESNATASARMLAKPGALHFDRILC